MSAVPESFHPLIQAWFAETYGNPTAVQAQAWPVIERGEHVLALAPTGSGKTLTAFLSAISRFCPAIADGDDTVDGGTAGATRHRRCRYPADKLTVLYVSPLKALNEDIKRNLLEPLAAIRSRFEETFMPFPDIRVETRSGDTPQSQRRRFLAHPPSILALTPESLAILLLSARGRQALSTVRYVILDEIHAVLGNKRGSFLSCQIDRLALLAGEFQRVSLSATIRPPEIAAEFVGGIGPSGKGRTVRIVAPETEKQIELTIEYPDIADDTEQIQKYGRRYSAVINYVLNRVTAGSTILVFTDSRRRAERLCYCINEEAKSNASGCDVAFTHHGSLSKEIRQSVEQRLARGELPCVVATASLELGIDIGSVDEVILAGSPGIVSQALQRIGRSGHGVGKVSRGKLFPFHGMDLLLATAVKGAVDDRDIEEVRPIENPLDILAQIILALCVEKDRNIEELYTLLRGFYIYKNLNHESYIRTVRMLAGLGTNGRLRELKPRIWMDNVTGEIGALDGSLLLLYSSGGVIANRGQYSLRLNDGTKIGEVDEEFVWERRLGDKFHFGGRGWRITNIGAEAVEIVPLEKPADFIPFWHADINFRSSKITNRVLAILDNNNTNISNALCAFLHSQREAQGDVPLSCSTNITIEIIDSPENHGDLYSVVVHNFRGGAVNYPLALALTQELEETLQLRVESFSNDDSILFLIPRMGIPVDEIIRNAFMSLNSPDNGHLSRGERLFRNRLEVSGAFGANFREAAERSLLLPKAGFGKRTPLWLTRQRSKRLFDTVLKEEGFSITAEAWRSCLIDMFDMEGFRDIITSINDGSIRLSFFYSSAPSPFSRDMVRQETNALMYEYDERKDTPGGIHTASLSDRVIEEALGNAELRPTLKKELVENFTARLRREIPGWAPDDELSLCEWVKERIAIPLDEWETLYTAIPEKLKLDFVAPGNFTPYLAERLRIITRNSAAIPSVVHREWETSWNEDGSSAEFLALLSPWLRYQGPISLQRIAEVFGVSVNLVNDMVNELVKAGEIIAVNSEQITDNSEQREEYWYKRQSDKDVSSYSVHCSLFPVHCLICDRENLDMLLRLSRKKARPEIHERPASAIVPFLAMHQGILCQGLLEGPRDSGNNFLKNLAACSAPAKLWETEFFPARCNNYRPEIIDSEIREGRLVWYGTGKEKTGICPVDDLDLVFTNDHSVHFKSPYTEAFTQAIDSGFFDRPRDFWDIKAEITKMTTNAPLVSSTDIINALWQEVWQGRLSSDSFEPVRRGVELGFKYKAADFVPKDAGSVPKDAGSGDLSAGEQIPAGFMGRSRRPQIPRALRDRWKSGAPVRGGWFSLADNWSENTEMDPLNEEMRNRDRVRLLLARWGILCRPLLERESSPFTWSGLLPAMRRMELAGELVAGRFFAGINSLQFASPAIAQELAETIDGLYWMNASDPASPAGLEIQGLDPRIPARLSSTRLYFRRDQLIAVTCKNGKDMQIFLATNDADMSNLVELFKIPRTRKVAPESKIVIENINGAQAAHSEYAGAFRDAGFVPDRGRLCLW